jgi:hypothetical protein
MAPQHAYLPDAGNTFAHPLPMRDHLSLVQPTYLTFADGVELRRSGPWWRREQRRSPSGLVHAAHLHSPQTLCGVPLETLEAFGRSRHPFERLEAARRCSGCGAAAGRPAV